MTQLLPDIFAIEVPDKSSLFELNNGCELFLLPHPGHSVRKKWAIFPPGSYEILFTTKGVSEAQAAGVVDRQLGNGKFKDYECVGSLAQFGEYIFSTATESIHSLLRSKGLMAGNYLIIKKIV